MGKERAPLPPPSSALYGGGERGAGGKFRKTPIRRPPSTPYDRPPPNQSITAAQHRDGGWLSKFVDPARRLITSGATRIFPSFFSTSPLAAAEDHDNGGTEVEENACGDNQGSNLNLVISESAGGTNPRKGADKFKGSSDFDQLGQGKVNNLPDDCEFSKIEQLVTGRRFSRAEINRLTEILNSRVADVSNAESEEKKQNTATKREGEVTVLACENPRTSTEEKLVALSSATLGTSLPMLQSIVKEEVGASPVDIARAYMGSRASEVGTDSRMIMSKDERDLLRTERFASEPLISSPCPKTSVCWPGAMVHGQHGCSTPENPSARHGLHYFPRTPYSRTIYSKSKLTHLQADKNRHLNVLSTPRRQHQTPPYGQDEVLSGNRSVGPIRHLRRKFLSEAPPRGSASFHFSQYGPSQAGNSDISEGFFPAIKKNLEAGAPGTSTEFQSADSTPNSSEIGTPTLPTPNPAVRTILEHLDRNRPTPKEKSAELQLAIAGKKFSSSEVTNSLLKEPSSLPQLEGFNFHKNIKSIEKESSARGNDGRNLQFKIKSQERSTSEATDVVNKDIEASTSINGSHDSQIKTTHETDSLFLLDSRQKSTNEPWPLCNQNKGQGIANMAPTSTGLNPIRKPPFHSTGSKPILASISVKKPGLRQTVFSDNTSGFTFPVSASSSLFIEPPTPSIMPFTSASGLPQPKDEPAMPSYSFGTKKSTPALVFSFPSTSAASMQDGTSNLKFSFGSDKKNRISFKSVGNAIC